MLLNANSQRHPEPQHPARREIFTEMLKKADS